METSREYVEQVACLFFKAGTPLDPLAEACFRFSSKIALRRDEAVFVETGRSRWLYTQPSLDAKLRALSRRFGLAARLSFAGNAATALAIARFNESRPACLPLEALVDYASPFERNPELSKSVMAMVAKLRSLGLASLGDFTGLPALQVGSRFPPEAAGLWQSLRQGAPELWPPFKPAELIEERSSLLGPEQGQGCVNLEGLLFGLKPALERLMARLRGRDLRLSTFELGLDLDRKIQRVLRFKLPLPQSGPLELLRLVHERLGAEFQRRSLPAPVIAVHIKVIETAPGAARQVDLFSKQEEESEAFHSLLGRLSQRLGPGKVYQAGLSQRYRPERAWAKRTDGLAWPLGQKGPAPLPLFQPRRPLRLLLRPQPLLVARGSDLRGPQGQRWKLLEAEGPERLCGDWEQDEACRGFVRDYFRLVCGGGENLWVFCVPGKELEALAEPGPWAERQGEAFYLHGFFD
jgi:protein ImuB